jgi:hypothetical protein
MIEEYSNLKHGKFYFSYGCNNVINQFMSGVKEHTLLIRQFHPEYDTILEICRIDFLSSDNRAVPYGMNVKFDYEHSTHKQVMSFLKGFERFQSKETYFSGNNHNSQFSMLLRYLKSKKIRRIEYNKETKIFGVKQR